MISHLRSFRLTTQSLLRIIADISLINSALILALAVRFFYLIAFESQEGISNRDIFINYTLAYRNSFWLLTLVCLFVFFLNGFYTYGRAYRGQYKALIIIQAVSLSYLIFGFIQFFSETLRLPRGALVLAWGISLVIITASRVWSLLWRNVVKIENQVFEKDEENKKPRHILVIGGAGYIGSALIPKLLERGYRVRLLDLLLYGTEPIEHVKDHPNLEVINADFRHVDKIVEAMHGVDAVVHLGAIVGDPACALDHNLTVEINLVATRTIAEIAKGSHVNRFVFASTCSVYGANDVILDEKSVLNPVSLYARSKIASERVLTEMARDTFSPTLLRFGTIYGFSGRSRFDLVVNLLTAQAMFDKKITIMGGDQWRPFLHVDDAALSIVKTLEAPLSLVHNEVFNVGSDSQNYKISDVGELIHRMIPDAELIKKDFDSDRRNYRVSFSKIRNTLEFAPQWTLEKGIQQVIDAIKGGLIQDYREAKYSNVKFLNEANSYQRIPLMTGWANELLNDLPPNSTPQVETANSQIRLEPAKT